ncbi:NADH/ubiquinone/plastoquinone (complex I) [Chelativorans sp. ZYF759]|uniref:complex I subunit 5 family protein n=1 Tax=Chelativorans sp. ZYF759 TaxID=2692213 RepID=UPI00145E2779|nr:complex I subunit 5 family protein [Chelativorans sp. ZYF759]NMG40218.1 NADH/ubiquinone/plastoquinone (complex I) [Chelativorans sp. ZYF759]
MNAEALILLAPVVALPLLLSVLALSPIFNKRALDLLPVAPLPGLIAAFLVPAGTVLEAPALLFGLRLEMTGEGALFLGFASALWMAAGFFARAYMKGGRDLAVFCAFWCLTLAGNLTVFLAGDAATFYLAFTCVSLAAYPLVVHERNVRAMRAGLVYIVLALIGETLLLLGVLLAVAAADGILISDVRDALGASGDSLTIALLVAGFGIKAGMVPLHVWLPLAHPAAPTPASAVLSGAIVKAGIFGLIQFLPLGSDAGTWGQILMAIGIFGSWFGILVGLTQSNPKTVLAYSTVSQMGIVIAAIGGGLEVGAGAVAVAAATLYALHHGLAKGALFMGVGVMQKIGRKGSGYVTAALTLVALSVAGLPLLGGALAKLAIKPPLGGGVAELLVTASAAGTSLLLLRFLFLVQDLRSKSNSARPPLAMTLPFAAMGAGALVMPWLLFEDWSGQDLAYAFELGNLGTALWPLLAGGALAAVFVGFRPRRLPAVPEGDLVVPIEALARRGMAAWRRGAETLPHAAPEVRRPLLAAAGLWLGRVEGRLANWAVAGTLMVLLLLAMLLADRLLG